MSAAACMAINCTSWGLYWSSNCSDDNNIAVMEEPACGAGCGAGCGAADGIADAADDVEADEEVDVEADVEMEVDVAVLFPDISSSVNSIC